MLCIAGVEPLGSSIVCWDGLFMDAFLNHTTVLMGYALGAFRSWFCRMVFLGGIRVWIDWSVMRRGAWRQTVPMVVALHWLHLTLAVRAAERSHCGFVDGCV